MLRLAAAITIAVTGAFLSHGSVLLLLFSVLLFVCIVLIRPAWIVYAIIFYILAAGGHKKRRYTRINKQAAKTKPLLN